jgi:predicted Zn-dependent protease with MMP-like domain
MDPWTELERACELVDTWQLADAQRRLAQLERDEELAPFVWREQALLCELRGENAAADALYRRAAELEPENCPLPVRMSDDEALALLRQVIESMPVEVRATLDNVRIDLVDMPDPKADAGPDLCPDLLGLYQGVPIIDSDDARSLSLPGRIRVFKRNVERLALDRDELIAELRITLLHEIGHHIGWDEDELEERGLG